MLGTIFCVFLGLSATVLSQSEFTVHFAINAGGDALHASDQIFYQADDVHSSFDRFTTNKLIDLVSPRDAPLYQSIRHHHEKFGYKIPIPKKGNYLIQLKFAEIREDAQIGSRLIDVVFNHKHRVVKDLDVFAKTGTFVAHFEYVYFKVEDYKLYWNDEVSDIGHYLPVEFVRNKGSPFVSAIVMYEGKVEVIPKLPWTVSQEQNKCVQVVKEVKSSKKLDAVVVVESNEGTVNVYYKPTKDNSTAFSGNLDKMKVFSIY